jgi:hypothetical protein
MESRLENLPYEIANSTVKRRYVPIPGEIFVSAVSFDEVCLAGCSTNFDWADFVSLSSHGE